MTAGLDAAEALEAIADEAEDLGCDADERNWIHEKMDAAYTLGANASQRELGEARAELQVWKDLADGRLARIEALLTERA